MYYSILVHYRPISVDAFPISVPDNVDSDTVEKFVETSETLKKGDIVLLKQEKYYIGTVNELISPERFKEMGYVVDEVEHIRTLGE